MRKGGPLSSTRDTLTSLASASCLGQWRGGRKGPADDLTGWHFSTGPMGSKEKALWTCTLQSSQAFSLESRRELGHLTCARLLRPVRWRVAQ